jgi:hypothetical protein
MLSSQTGEGEREYHRKQSAPRVVISARRGG